MISIVENTGFVVNPYFYFPEILTHIRNLIQIEQSVSIKKLVFKLIGTLGALDPYLVKQITLYYNSTDGLDDSDIKQNIPILQEIDTQLWNPEYVCQDENNLMTQVLKKRIENNGWLKPKTDAVNQSNTC